MKMSLRAGRVTRESAWGRRGTRRAIAPRDSRLILIAAAHCSTIRRRENNRIPPPLSLSLPADTPTRSSHPRSPRASAVGRITRIWARRERREIKESPRRVILSASVSRYAFPLTSLSGTRERRDVSSYISRFDRARV